MYGYLKSSLCCRYLTDEQLVSECGIINSIHRQKLRSSIQSKFYVWFTLYFCVSLC